MSAHSRTRVQHVLSMQGRTAGRGGGGTRPTRGTGRGAGRGNAASRTAGGTAARVTATPCAAPAPVDATAGVPTARVPAAHADAQPIYPDSEAGRACAAYRAAQKDVDEAVANKRAVLRDCRAAQQVRAARVPRTSAGVAPDSRAAHALRACCPQKILDDLKEKHAGRPGRYNTRDTRARSIALRNIQDVNNGFLPSEGEARRIAAQRQLLHTAHTTARCARANAARAAGAQRHRSLGRARHSPRPMCTADPPVPPHTTPRPQTLGLALVRPPCRRTPWTTMMPTLSTLANELQRQPLQPPVHWTPRKLDNLRRLCQTLTGNSMVPRLRRQSSTQQCSRT